VFEHARVESIYVEEASRADDQSVHYPTTQDSWSHICVFCGVGEVELEGYSNLTNAVYRCWHCGEAMICQPDMDELHWRYQVFPLTLETNAFDRDVRYPMRGVQLEEEVEEQ
jgi:hypothetical protein